MSKKAELRRRGRPTKFTPPTINTLCKMVAMGLQWERAAAMAGLEYRTVARWRKAGREGKAIGNISAEKLIEFVAKLESAEAAAEANCVEAWMSCVQQGDWKAAQEFLARRFPERWAKKSTLDVNVAAKTPVQVWTPRADVRGLEDGEQ